MQKKYYTWFIVFMCLALCTFHVSAAYSDILVDNGASPGTAQTGTWNLSGGTDPYGGESLWSRNGATYTWQFDSQPSGTYEVLMWWSGYPSRTSNIAVTINEQNGPRNLTIDQSVNAGRWNSLGTYYFDGTGSVMITAAQGDTLSTCADAVWFRFVSDNLPPAARIVSITPNPAEPGQTIFFEGEGTDSDGTVRAYLWESNIDGVLGESASFSTDILSEGVHTITLEVRDNGNAWSAPATETLTIGSAPQETIIDNSDTATSYTGWWSVSGADGFYGTDSIWSRDGSTFIWHFQPVQTSTYTVSMWWTEWSSRSISVPVDIEHAGGTARVYVNQQTSGGQWNPLGTYTFQAGTGYRITLYAPDPWPSSYCADAMKFSMLQSVPVANFSASPRIGDAPLTVAFTDSSTGEITGWAWDFDNDGTTDSTARNPSFE
ncbi:MAG: hypothetical protein M0P57_12115, partial [Syntrophales bacterium]|nr:hypothetical protein [Syntrophales bacterium]